MKRNELPYRLSLFLCGILLMTAGTVPAQSQTPSAADIPAGSAPDPAPKAAKDSVAPVATKAAPASAAVLSVTARDSVAPDPASNTARDSVAAKATPASAAVPSVTSRDSVAPGNAEALADSLPPAEAFADTASTALDTTAIGQESDSLLLNAPPLAQKRFVPNPQRALWLSLIIPGAGQIYNRKLWKIPIVYGGFLGCLYALTWNNQMYGDYSQAYLDIMDDDPETKSYENMLPLNFNIEGREDQYKEIFKNKKNYYRKYRDMSIFAMIAVYILSVVDAYVDAELSSFDISKDLSLRLEPAVFDIGGRKRDASVGVQCNLNF